MSSLVPTVTIANLLQGTDISSRTLTLWLQLVFSAGYYTVGGVPAGVATYAGSQTVDAAAFLQSFIQGEDPQTTSPAVGGYRYKYNPTNDTIQIFLLSNGVELGASAAIPAEVLNDVIVGQFVYNRA